MATYYFAVAVDKTVDAQSDGKHYTAQYGFGLDPGTGVQALGSSGAQGLQFESVSVAGRGGKHANTFCLTVMTPMTNANSAGSFVRCAFRPAHDLAPATSLLLSPFNSGDTATLLRGLLLSDKGVTLNSNIKNGKSYGLPSDSYAYQWIFGDTFKFSGPGGKQGHFELTFEMVLYLSDASDPICFKVDPEMMIDF